MKSELPSTNRWRTLAAFVFLLAFAALSAAAETMKFETQLIWATNDPQSPDPKQKAVDAETQKKLAELPLKWANYFQVCKQHFQLPQGAVKKEKMSGKCQIQVTNLRNSEVEVTLFGEGVAVCKRTQSLAKGEMVVFGGHAPNSTAWLVTLKRKE